MPNMTGEAKSYATKENAVRALTRAGVDLEKDRYIIGVNENNRFVPVLIGLEYIPFAWKGIRVIN